MFNSSDNKNPNNRIEKWLEKHETTHPLIQEYLYGKSIDKTELVSSIFAIVLPLYQKNKEEKERLHRIIDPIEFAKEVGLPFEFTEYNVTPKIRDIISKHEKMCYEMSN